MTKILRLFFVFGLIFPALANANVIFNEIAWMGTEIRRTYEWMELYNNGTDDVDLTGWGIYEEGGGLLIKPLVGIISSGGYFLIERTTDEAVPNIPASQDPSSWGGYGLNNAGEHLALKDTFGNIVDEINAQDGWPAGDNNTKQTMQWDGVSWITANATPLAENPLAQSQQQEESQNSQASQPAQTIYKPQPTITARAGEDKTVIVGAETEYRGEAYGLTGDPMDNARFLWSFGDGTIKEGKNVMHVYKFSGTYLVVLNISSGKLSGSDSIKVTAMPNELYISEVKSGTASWIEIHNPSDITLDLSRWILKGPTGKMFIFPGSTMILPNSYIVVDGSVSDITLLSMSGVVGLMYPGGFIANSFMYQKILGGGFTYNMVDEKIIVGHESPGGGFVQILENKKPVAPGIVVDTKNTQKIQPEDEEQEDIATTTDNIIQNINVDEKQSNGGALKWFLLSLVVGIVGAAGFILTRRAR